MVSIAVPKTLSSKLTLRVEKVDLRVMKASKNVGPAFFSFSAGGGLGGVSAIQELAVETKMQETLMNGSMVKVQHY